MGLDFEVSTGGSVSDPSPDSSDPESSAFDYLTAVALTNVTGSRPTSGIGLRVPSRTDMMRQPSG